VGVLSPTKCDDPTARNLRTALERAGLDEDDCLFWNAVPWHVERGAVTRHLRLGAGYLAALVDLLPDLAVVVAMGRTAQRTVAFVPGGLPVPMVETWHSSNLALNREPGRRNELAADLARAALLARGVARTGGGSIDEKGRGAHLRAEGPQTRSHRSRPKRTAPASAACTRAGACAVAAATSSCFRAKRGRKGSSRPQAAGMKQGTHLGLPQLRRPGAQRRRGSPARTWRDQWWRGPRSLVPAAGRLGRTGLPGAAEQAAPSRATG
jgi:hypothetical protein